MHSNWKNPLAFVSSLYQKRVLVSEVIKSRVLGRRGDENSQQLLILNLELFEIEKKEALAPNKSVISDKLISNLSPQAKTMRKSQDHS